PLLLAGAWCETEADREAVATLARSTVDELNRLAVRWAHEPDPPLRLVGGMWEWVARLRAWPLLGRFLTPDDLAAFRRVAVTVLGEIDPRVNLPPDRRWTAGLSNQVPRYSGPLKEGLASGLALLATRGDVLPAVGDGAGFVGGVVRELFGGQTDRRRWYSLASVLPTLAEAAPDAFLAAVERDVLGDPADLATIFEEH